MMLVSVFLVSLVLSPSPQLLSAIQSEPNCGCEDKPPIEVLATVNGIKISRQDLSINTRTQVSILQDTVIEARNRELDLQINKTLLEAEAASRGLSTFKL